MGIYYKDTHALRSTTPTPAFPIDAAIRPIVDALWKAGVETYESCQGGVGHAFPEPTVRFHGNRSAGLRALSVAVDNGFPVSELRRVWPVIDGEITGPCWELIFFPGHGPE